VENEGKKPFREVVTRSGKRVRSEYVRKKWD